MAIVFKSESEYTAVTSGGCAVNASTAPLDQPMGTNAQAPQPRRGIPVSIPHDELIFWTKDWIDREQEAAAEYARGDFKRFANGREAAKDLFRHDD